MELQILTRNVDADEALHEYIQKKLLPLSRHFRPLPEIKIELRREHTRSAHDQMVVQMTVALNDILLRAEERAATIMAAVDAAASALDTQLLRHKDRRYRNLQGKRSGRGNSLRSPEAAAAEPRGPSASSEEVEGPPQVVRIKQFPMKPLSVEEAATQMELLGHTFFFFLNSGTHRYNVLYRRRDGNYGLIEPQAG